MNMIILTLFYINKRHDIVKYAGGIPSSLVDSGQQWDFPNAWPPLVHFVIQTLRGHGHAGADKMAAHLAHIWLNSNYLSWKKTGHMFEKVNFVTA
jgi:alpha,alpha-trehalase